MATQGIEGNGVTLGSTAEQDLYKRSDDGGAPLEFDVRAETDAITFRIYADEEKNTLISRVTVPAGEARSLMDNRQGNIKLLTGQSSNTGAIPAWYPSISGA